jgi:hypothetical protein
LGDGGGEGDRLRFGKDYKQYDTDPNVLKLVKLAIRTLLLETSTFQYLFTFRHAVYQNDAIKNYKHILAHSRQNAEVFTALSRSDLYNVHYK